MNFSQINLDLQSTMKKIYASLLYRASSMKLANRRYMEAARTETAVIEVVKAKATPVNTRLNVELANSSNVATPITPVLATYDSVKVDLTELRMDYSFMVSPIAMESGLIGAIDDQLDLKDAEIANKIDTYNYNKLGTGINGSADGSLAYTQGQCIVWSPSTGEDIIEGLNVLKAILFNRNVYDGFILGLNSINYAYLVAGLTSVLKYETRVGVEGVDMGTIARAYGVDIFQINDNVLTNGEVGYFGNEVGFVSDIFFSAFNQFASYPGLPGYYVCEGNVFAGSAIIRPEAIIKLVSSLPVVTAGTFDAGTAGSAYSQTTAFSGTGSATFKAEGLPEGLSLNESTGAVTGTPTTAGSYDVVVYGIDTDGNYSNAYTGTIVIS